ncbi:MAG: hypothetical protein V2J89_04610 [Halieaceae bacterium]|jgi:hypothetical protein|nr:hypothetical protein [Halieaceae bacterium]
MEFSEKEQATIRAARDRLDRARQARIICIVAMLLIVAALLAGAVSSVFTVFSMLALGMICSAFPQLAGRPRYEDLATLLASKLEENDTAGNRA